MTRRELRSLAELGSTSVHHRLRSGPSRASLSVMEGDVRVGAEETSVPQAADIQELREKLQMAQEELELMRADLTRQLEQAQQTAAEERAGLAEQLRQAQRMSDCNLSWRGCGSWTKSGSSSTGSVTGTVSKLGAWPARSLDRRTMSVLPTAQVSCTSLTRA